jgi:hypothetical protein
MQRIADADTLLKKRGVELEVMNGRLNNEMRAKVPIDDGYGMDRINTMIVDIYAQYVAMGVNLNVSHDTGVADTEGDEDEEEERDSDHEPRSSNGSSERYVCRIGIYIY